MIRTEQFASLIEDALTKVKTSGNPDSLYEPIRYSIAAGGKRMRPMLCLLSAWVFTDKIERAIAPALAIEIFHNFTLLHDDIMDSAPTRRGQPTVWKCWNENRAILSGDAMMILAYKILSQAEHLKEQIEVFNRAAIEVCEGQQLDIEFESRDNVTLDEYIEMIRLKTAALMAAAMQMGAIAAGATEQEAKRLYRYGENLGIAFQIQDDLLDTYGNSATFGKQIGGDIAEGKQTFLRIAALSKATAPQIELLQECRDYDVIRAIYDCTEVEIEAHRAINHYFTEAAKHLTGFAADRLAPMESYAETLLKRNK